MAKNLSNKYFVKRQESDSWQDIATLFSGVVVLKVDGLNAKGEPINIYNAQWQNSQREDFMITNFDKSGNPVVIRKNTDIDITFIVRQKYANSQIDVLTQHDAFVNYMTNSDVWIKSKYCGGKQVHCICLKEYKPSAQKLFRGDNSYMMGTITLHTLDKPSV